MSLTIRPITTEEFDLVWPIFEPIIREGKTYSYDPKLTMDEARAIWCAPEKTPFVALAGDRPVGTFYIRANQLGLGNHIANGGFMVAPGQCGKGYGTAMGEAMVKEARRLGYHGMQFNFIVQDNEPSLRIWKKLGFEIVGTVPDAMRHAEKGLMPVHILYKKL
jgi:Sortase and related acyltransferases